MCPANLQTTPNTGKSIYLLECRAETERDLDRWEKWANKNLRKFNKSKCKNLHLGCRCTSTPRGSTSWEAALQKLVNIKQTVNQQSILAAKANCLVGCTNKTSQRLREVLSVFYSALATPQLWLWCAVFWAPH